MWGQQDRAITDASRVTMHILRVALRQMIQAKNSTKIASKGHSGIGKEKQGFPQRSCAFLCYTKY
jgi:hypothetical protein